MTPEQFKQEMQLIFARACAESLRESVGYILRDDLKEEKARAHGEAFASAFVFMSRYFTGVQAAPLEKDAEEARIQHANQAIADYWKDGGFRRSRRDSPAGRECSGDGSHQPADPAHRPECVDQLTPDAGAAEARPHQGTQPGQEASDACR